jgi:hypothetical protein
MLSARVTVLRRTGPTRIVYSNLGAGATGASKQLARRLITPVTALICFYRRWSGQDFIFHYSGLALEYRNPRRTLNAPVSVTPLKKATARISHSGVAWYYAHPLIAHHLWQLANACTVWGDLFNRLVCGFA